MASLYLKKRDFKKAEELIDQLFANRVLYAKEQSQYLSNDVRRGFNKLTLMDYETIFSLIEDLPRGKELAGILRATEGVEVTTVDSTKIPQGVDAQTFFESQINEAKENIILEKF